MKAPYSPEAELSVLGSMLIDAEALDAGLETLRPEMFHREGNRRCFVAMERIAARGAAVDAVTLSEELKAAGDLEVFGGLQGIGSLIEAVPTAANLKYHAGIVQDRWRERRMVEVGTHIVRLGHDGARAVAERVSEAEAEVLALADVSTVTGLHRLSDHLLEAFERMEKAELGVLSGLADLDHLTEGFKRKNLYLFAGRPSMGKSGLVVGFALEAAIRQGMSVAFFSTEMGENELMDRALAYEGMVDIPSLRNAHRKGRRDAMVEQWERHLTIAAGRIKERSLVIDCTAYTVAEMRARARRLKRDQGLHLIVIDHAHEMHGPGDNETQMYGGIAKDCKRMAKELDVPVILAAQLNRGVDARESKRPSMSDLRAAGGLEEAADFIGFVYRPEYYHGPVDKDRNNLVGKAELIVSKHRNGPTGTVNLFFRKECSRFENFASYRGD